MNPRGNFLQRQKVANGPHAPCCVAAHSHSYVHRGACFVQCVGVCWMLFAHQQQQLIRHVVEPCQDIRVTSSGEGRSVMAGRQSCCHTDLMGGSFSGSLVAAASASAAAAAAAASASAAAAASAASLSACSCASSFGLPKMADRLPERALPIKPYNPFLGCCSCQSNAQQHTVAGSAELRLISHAQPHGVVASSGASCMTAHSSCLPALPLSRAEPG
jgi:hypothetical protein